MTSVEKLYASLSWKENTTERPEEEKEEEETERGESSIRFSLFADPREHAASGTREINLRASCERQSDTGWDFAARIIRRRTFGKFALPEKREGNGTTATAAVGW